MNRLDEIAARAELAQGAWEDFQLGIATTRFALEEANNSAEDVKPLVSALKAVEAVHTKGSGHNPECDCGIPPGDGATCNDCGDYWPCPTITAIKDALGS